MNQIYITDYEILNNMYLFPSQVLVFKCAAPGCKTGYDNVIPEGVSLHNFPSVQNIFQKWLHALRRKDYSPGKSAKICSLHFHDSDFCTEYTDTNVTRKRAYGQQRKRRKLKDGAVPSVFPNLPSYLCSAKLVIYFRKTVREGKYFYDGSYSRI